MAEEETEAGELSRLPTTTGGDEPPPPAPRPGRGSPALREAVRGAGPQPSVSRPAAAEWSARWPGVSSGGGAQRRGQSRGARAPGLTGPVSDWSSAITPHPGATGLERTGSSGCGAVRGYCRSGKRASCASVRRAQGRGGRADPGACAGQGWDGCAQERGGGLVLWRGGDACSAGQRPEI